MPRFFGEKGPHPSCALRNPPSPSAMEKGRSDECPFSIADGEGGSRLGARRMRSLCLPPQLAFQRCFNRNAVHVFFTNNNEAR